MLFFSFQCTNVPSRFLREPPHFLFFSMSPSATVTSFPYCNVQVQGRTPPPSTSTPSSTNHTPPPHPPPPLHAIAPISSK